MNLKLPNNLVCQLDGISLVMHGEVCDDNLEWLNRSIVCEVSQPREVDSISMKVFQRWPIT